MKIAIVGGSHAGLACAIKARKEYPNSQIIIYEKQRNLGFVSQNILRYLNDEINSVEGSSYISISDLKESNIIVKNHTSVLNIDIESKLIDFIDLTNEVKSKDYYDKLVLATGSSPSLLPIITENSEQIFTLKTFKDATRLKKLMREARSIIIVGGGATGVELSHIFSKYNIETTLIHSSEYILNRYLDKEVSYKVQSSLEKKGVRIYTETTVKDIWYEKYEYKNKAVGYLVTKNGEKFVADGIIYAIGSRPNTFLAQNKISMNNKGAIIVDDYMQTNYPDIFAVGDCATTSFTNINKPIFSSNASDAIRQGEIAAINLKELKKKIIKSQGTYKLNYDSQNILCKTGLSLNQAKREGFDCDTAYVRDTYESTGLFFELWLVYEKGTHKILGMQSNGSAPEIAPQIDIISLAIHNGMTINDLEYVDFYFRHGYKNPKSFTKLIVDEIQDKEIRENNYDTGSKIK